MKSAEARQNWSQRQQPRAQYTPEREPEPIRAWFPAEQPGLVAECLSCTLRLQARQEGNALFKEGKFVEAITKYNDAMKRNPKDHVPYR